MQGPGSRGQGAGLGSWVLGLGVWVLRRWSLVGGRSPGVRNGFSLRQAAFLGWFVVVLNWDCGSRPRVANLEF